MILLGQVLLSSSFKVQTRQGHGQLNNTINDGCDDMWFRAGLDAREYGVDTEISRRRVPRGATDAEAWSLGI